MYTNSKLAKAVRSALILGATTTALSFNALAQDDTESAEELEKIQITGSRIKSANLVSPSPVQIIDASDIESSGVANIQDLLLENPTFGSPAINRTNSNFSTASAGVATVDLRDLGTDRTLVLVNGRRFVAGVPGSAAVDLNSIPVQFVERVEILTGGASSVYGSDAVAGVVNLILKEDYEGIEMEAQYGESSEGDAEETQLSLTAGVTSGDGKGNIMFHLGYTDQGAVYSRDRERSDTDQISAIYFEADPAANPNSIFEAVRPFFSSFPPQGRFTTPDGTYTFDQNNNLQLGFSTNGNGTIGPDGFNRMAYRTIAIPTERYLIASKGNYELSDDHQLFFETTYAATSTITELEPFPFSSDDIYATGEVPLEFEYNGNVYANPYVPTDILNSSVDRDNDGLRDLDFFAKRLLDVANRGNTADRDTFRFVVGMDGEVFEDWSYEVSYNWGSTKENQVGSGQFNASNFRYALEAIPDVDDFDGDGDTTEAVCLDATARAFGCVPIDVYGYNSISPEAAAWISAPNFLSTKTTQEVISGVISGDLLELPAGYMSIAGGFEHRKEYSLSQFDALQSTGQNGGNAIPPTEGKFDVTEFYVETIVPIIEDLNVRAAYRSSDYSTVGDVASWNIGAEWQINDEWRVRAVHALATRAPNINELFSPPSQTFPSGLTDPCEGIDASTTGATAEACRLDPGVQENIASNGSFTLNQADLQGISGFNRGNPEVGEEEGKTTTVGIIYTPEDNILEDFNFTLDYFDIEITEAIVSTPRQFILDQCYGGDASFCSFVTRRPTAAGTNSAGSLEFIDSAVSNSGGITMEGVDLTVNYRSEIGVGELYGRVAYTYLMEGDVVPLPGAAPDPFVGEIGTADHKAYINVGYDWSDFEVVWSTTYIGESDFDNTFLAGFGIPAESLGVDAVIYHDVQFKYNPTESIQTYVGVDNIFDEEPPAILTGVAGNSTGTETDASTYDAIGMRWYAGVRIKF